MAYIDAFYPLPTPVVLDDYPLMLTVDEVAAILGVGRWAVYGAVKSGKIPSIKIGRSLRIPRERLRAMIEGRDCALAPGSHDRHAPSGNPKQANEAG